MKVDTKSVHYKQFEQYLFYICDTFIIHLHQKYSKKQRYYQRMLNITYQVVAFFSFHSPMNPPIKVVVTKRALPPWFDVTVPDSPRLPFLKFVSMTRCWFVHFHIMCLQKKSSFSKL